MPEQARCAFGDPEAKASGLRSGEKRESDSTCGVKPASHLTTIDRGQHLQVLGACAGDGLERDPPVERRAPAGRRGTVREMFANIPEARHNGRQGENVVCWT